MSVEEKDKFFLQWAVKPVWKCYYPSTLIVGDGIKDFEIFGVDRGSLDINRNWAKIHSVEQFNQGFVAMPEDFVFTIAVKENGEAFEKLRRLSKGAILFDVEVDVLRKRISSGSQSGNKVDVGDLRVQYKDTTIEGYTPWMKGFEKYIGCIVNREGQTIEVGGIPIREFELTFLRHSIKPTTETLNGEALNTGDLKEGDGSYPTLDELSI